MRDVPVTYKYLLRRRKTRPRPGEPFARDLAAYSQAIAQMAERRELSLYTILVNIPHVPGTGAIDTMPCYSAVTW